MLFIGAGSTALTVAALGRLRVTPAWAIGWVASGLSLFLTHLVEWPAAPARRLVPTLVVGFLMAVGLERLRSAGVAASVRLWTLLAVCGAVWLAIPENRPILVVAGAVLAREVSAPELGGRWADSGFAVAVGWSVLLGAHIRDWAFVGGLLCAAPLVAIALIPPLRLRWAVPAGPWLVVGTSVLGFASARWVGVAPDATLARVVTLSLGAVALAMSIRR